MFKTLKKSITRVVSTLLLTCCVIAAPISSQVSYADQNLNNVVDSINNSSTQVMGNATKNKVTGLSKEIVEIVLVVVMTIIMVGGFMTAAKIRRAGDNSSEKAQLKARLVAEVGGVIFLASYFGFMKFGFTNLNFFK